MGVCIVSLIISGKNSCKIFSNNSQNYSSFYTEDSINKMSLTLSVLPQQNQIMKKNIHGVIVFDDLNHMKYCYF